MELKIGKRYLIARNVNNNYVGIDAVFETKETDTETLKLINEAVVDEISISGKYIKFKGYAGFPVIGSNWEEVGNINILEELPDAKIGKNETTKDNIYDKLLEVLTKVLDRKS